MKAFASIVDKVNAYVGSDVEKAILECTSMESWGSSNSLKKQITGYTHSYEAFDEAITLIFKRLEVDYQTATIVIYKTLDLILFMMSHGASPRFMNEVKRKRFMISKWVQFSFNDGEKDYSASIRQAAAKIMDLMDDPQALAEQQSESGGSYGNGSKYGGMGGGSSNSHSYSNYSQQPSHQYQSGHGHGNRGSQQQSRGVYGGQNHGIVQNQSKFGGHGHTPAQTHRADEFISHDSDIDVHSTSDPFTQPQPHAQQKRTIGQASTSNPGLQKPKQQPAQPTPAPAVDPFAEVANTTIVVSQTTDDPFAAAAGEFDEFTSAPAPTEQPTAQPQQRAPVQSSPPPAPHDDVFALLGAVDHSAAAAAGTTSAPQSSANSLLSLYDQPPQHQQSGFNNLNALYAQQPQQQPQQQQQQQQQQPFDMWAQPQQQPQQAFNPYEMASQSQNNMFFGGAPQQARPPQQQQQQQSADPFGDIFAMSSTTAPRQQQQPTTQTQQAPAQQKKSSDPFDFDF